MGLTWSNGRAASSRSPDPAEFPHLPKLIGDGAPQDSAADLVDAVAQHRAVVGARRAPTQRVSDRRWNLHS